jgi:acetyltransferase-like isoleucine patch superfamily enzyme
MKRYLSLLIILLPWPLRRAVLRRFFGYEIADTSRIGLSWIFPKKLVMKEGARIGHLTICKDIDLLQMEESSHIGNLDWITGYPSDLQGPGHFGHQPDRRPELLLSRHAAITNRHFIDCTERIQIGPFATVAGFASQLMTHSVNIEFCRQEAYPINIGAYCFVGTNCVLLGGSALPDYCVLGAKSLLNQAFTESYYLYGGVPAKPIKALPPTNKYFQRTSGFII